MSNFKISGLPFSSIVEHSYLEDHPHVKTVYLHLDNDTAGRLAARAIMAVMPEDYRVENRPPPRGKDVNDFLCHRLGIPIRGSHGKVPER